MKLKIRVSVYLFAIMWILLISTNSCKKSVDPSRLQLLTSSLWRLSIDCSGKIINDEEQSVTTLKTNGYYTIASNVYDDFSGTWSLKDNDETLILDHTDYKIVVLTERELRITSTTEGCTISFNTVISNKVATDAEWTTLTTYLGGLALAGGKLKEFGTMHWDSPNADATNESGFTAVPVGNRSIDGLFNYFPSLGFWWCSTNGAIGSAWGRSMVRGFSNVDRYNSYAYDKLTL